MRKKNTCFVMFLLLVCLCLATASASSILSGERNPGNSFLVDCNKAGHNWEAVSALSATCDSPVQVTYQCTRCSAKKTETEGDALGHDWRSTGITHPDCENPGKETLECVRCHKKVSKVLSALGHNWMDPVVIKEPTCTEAGTKKDECENCGKELFHEIDPTGHDWKNTRIIREATCTTEGKAEAKCLVCGHEGTRTLKKLPHTYSEWKITRQATEKTKGTRTATCDICGKKTTEKFDYVPGDIAIYTNTGKVNLRAGAGKSNKHLGQVSKKGTYLGQLYEAKPDKNDTVWYKVKYKNKYCWVMSDYAEARVETDYDKERLPDATGSELSNYIFKSFDPVKDILELQAAAGDDEATNSWTNEDVYLSGEEFIDNIVLSGDGYTLYGVKIGDKIKNALSVLKKTNLVLVSEESDSYTYRIPALPDSLCVSDTGFCAYLTISLDSDKKVEQIHLYSDFDTDW